MFAALFTDPQTDALFGDQAVLGAVLRFEGALALAQAEAGLVSAEHAAVITRCCDEARIAPEAIAAAARTAGNPVLPLVRELTRLVAAEDPRAAGAVHLGATSQDALDTAVMLQLQAALVDLDAGSGRLERALVGLIARHRRTVMLGRTLLQPARPISFAFKLAVWLDGLHRARERLRRVQAEALVVQFGGAVGTLAATGDAGTRIRAGLARRLGLGEPAIAWHPTRDRLFEAAAALVALAGALAKMATDAALLMQAEVGELAEGGSEDGRGASSALPHKRNPVAPTLVTGAFANLPGLLATMAAGLVQEHERAVGRWHAEWHALPAIVGFTAGALRAVHELFDGLVVDGARMRQNLAATGGLAFAEEVAVALRARLGKVEADRVVRAACARAREENVNLAEVLARDPAAAAVLDREALGRLFSPEAALGLADEQIERVLRLVGAGQEGQSGGARGTTSASYRETN